MLFFVVIFAITLGDVLWWIWAHRATRRFARPSVWQPMIAAFSIAQLSYIIFFVIAPVMARRTHVWTPMPIVVAIYLWHLLIMPGTLIAVGMAWCASKAITLSRYAGRGKGEVRFFNVQRSTSNVQRPIELNTQSDDGRLTRRQLLTAAAITVPPLATIAVTGRAMQQLGDFRVRSFDVPIANLPSPLEGLTIAHVSDTHIGRFTRSGILGKIIDTTNRLRADLVLFTGDLIDMSLADLPAGIDFLKRLDPRHGMMMIEGNHDLFADPDEFERRVRGAGLPLLLDDSRTLVVRGYPVQFLGIRWGRLHDWPRRHSSNAVIRESVADVVRLRDPNAFPILLAHHPHAFDTAIEAKIPLTLSGHTHGGQLMLTEKLGAGSIAFKYWSGLYRKGNSSLVVSNGTGNWFPLRINAPAEIVHVTLRAV